MYQESERLERREVILGTLSNFATRFLICLTFVAIVSLFWKHAVAIGIAWGMVLLAGMSSLVARGRKGRVITAIAKHIGIAVLVILVSEGIGHWISVHVT